jgi:hypothetical protein
LRLVIADIEPDHEIRREADEPGVLVVVRGAGLAGDAAVADLLQRGAGAALDTPSIIEVIW